MNSWSCSLQVTSTEINQNLYFISLWTNLALPILAAFLTSLCSTDVLNFLNGFKADQLVFIGFREYVSGTYYWCLRKKQCITNTVLENVLTTFKRVTNNCALRECVLKKVSFCFPKECFFWKDWICKLLNKPVLQICFCYFSGDWRFLFTLR